MKNFFAVLFLFLFITGCSSFKVTVNQDPFKGITVVKADMWHKVIDQNSLVFDNQRVLYEKEIKNGMVSDPTAYFLFQLYVVTMYGYSGEDFEKTAYIVCDDKNFKANIINYSKVERQHISGKAEVNYVSGTTSAKVGSSHSVTVTGKIVLTPDIQQAISNCSTYMIRFYLAGNNAPVTLRATDGQLESVKEFFSVNASTIEKK